MTNTYSGPAVVVAQQEHNTVTVRWPRDPDAPPERVHVKRVKRFNALRSGTTMEELLWAHVPTHMYVVERVVGHKTQAKELWVEIKWWEWDLTYNTWEPVNGTMGKDNLVVRAYCIAHGLKWPGMPVAPKAAPRRRHK
jgi:hypothetical protein